MFSSLGFLAPLYAAAALTVVVPVVLHLIRRTPRGRQTFSSLMFLNPSPPTVTRRSRIEHWLLLILRGLAVLAMVGAFCRPLWRQPLAVSSTPMGTRTLLLVDVSASVRRGDVWNQVIQQTEQVLEELGPEDSLSIVTFSDTTTTLLSEASWQAVDPPLRAKLLQDQLEELQPGWGGTRLGPALIQSITQLEQNASRATISPSTGAAAIPSQLHRRIVVVSDFQEESGLQELQGYQWPENLIVELRAVVATPLGNAGVHPVGLPELGDQPFVRVRVTNSNDSTQEQFHLGWQDPFAPSPSPVSNIAKYDPTTLNQSTLNLTTIGELIPVYVPPGQSRVVQIARGAEDKRPGGVIVLTGDAHPFDNACCITWPTKHIERIVSLGTDAIEDRRGMRFFLEPVFAETPRRTVEVIDWPLADAVWPTSATPPSDDVTVSNQPPRENSPKETTPADLVIVSTTPSDAQIETLRQFMATGGKVLYVLRDVGMGPALGSLIGQNEIAVQEAVVTDFTLLREVDFTHPVFAPLADPQFSDLSKLHFWSHRVIAEKSLPGLRSLARFDDGSLALGELPAGRGSLFVLTAGWHRDESEMTGWSKFVPVMNALLEYSSRQQPPPPGYLVGDLVSPGSTLRATSPGLMEVLTDATDGDTQNHGNGAMSQTTLVAVNLPPGESRTAPLPSSHFAQLGFPLDGKRTTQQREQAKRTQETHDIEAEQKLWRWLLLIALALLIAETVVASRAASGVAASST